MRGENMSVLAVQEAEQQYNSEKKVLKKVSFTIQQGEFVSIIGPSGAGKSTLLRCINRLVALDGGVIEYGDQDIAQFNKTELRKHRASMGMIFQHYNLVSRLTVIENVLHGRLGYKSSLQGVFSRFTEEEKREAFYLLEKLGMADHAYKRCDQLSGGQKQRVGIARALIQQPKLLLCDEPIASLDPNAAKVIMDHLFSITKERNITCIVNLHQVDVAKKYSDRIIGLHDGTVIYDGPAQALSTVQIHQIYGSEAGDLIMDLEQ